MFARKVLNIGIYVRFFIFCGDCSLQGMIPVIIADIEMMLERWKHYEGKEVELLEEFRLLTSEVISKAAFGSNLLL